MATESLVLITSIATVFSLVGFLANGLVLYLIFTTKSLRTPMNYLLLNLAIMDAITCCLTVPHIATGAAVYPGNLMLMQNIARSSEPSVVTAICKIRVFAWLGSTVQPYLLIAVAFERFMAVVYPLTSCVRVTKSRLRWIIPLCWIGGLLYVLPQMIALEYDDVLETCRPMLVNYSVYAYSTALLVLIFIIPALVITGLYLKVIRVLSASGQGMGIAAEQARMRKRAKRKVVNLVIAVTALFNVCWGFNNVLFYVMSSINDPDLKRDIPLIRQLCMSFSAAINPIFYLTFLNNFR
ncbi:predicted protein, partial [Nematostella vectensis]